MKALVLGDTHGEFKSLSFAIRQKKDLVDVVLQTGDFGFWPRWDYQLDKLKTYGKRIYFVDGNHEDHQELRKLIPTVQTLEDYNPIQIHENVFYVPRGCIFTPSNGTKRILGVGGAMSGDRMYRKEGWDVFADVEQPTILERKMILEESERGADVLLSHTVPAFCHSTMHHSMCNHVKFADYTCNFLDNVVIEYDIKEIFTGHWHTRKEISTGGVTTTILANIETNKMSDAWDIIEI